MKLLLLFFACSGEPPIEACEIEQADQSGLYTMETEETWGDCGSMGTLETEIENGLVKLDEGLGCEGAEDTWDQPERHTLSTVSAATLENISRGCFTYLQVPKSIIVKIQNL